ncbi:MAG: hypothetical protein HRU41_04715 [Saprospiraceae bacterium]|nr:hypothetical protein [Saprospiraceae bacterium]
MPKNIVTVVIRSSNERTEAVCKYFAELQVPADSVFIIRERPFRKAVSENFKIGLSEGRKWTLALDADVLLRENAVTEMIDKAESLGDELFIYQGFVLDKLFRNTREGGPHLYQTKHLKRALEHVTENDAVWRPESDTYEAMAKEGFTFHVDDIIYGLHDYEQYYRDIFRKAFFHARKHNSRTAQFVEDWSQRLEDMDYRVAIQGLMAGILYEEEFQVDISFFHALSKAYMRKENIVEKRELLEAPSSSFPSQFIHEFENTSAHVNLYTKRLPKLAPTKTQQLKKLLFHYPGRVLEEIGHILQNLAH